MRRRGVLSVLAGCAALLAVAIPGLGAASAAPPPVTIAGSLPAAVTGPGTETLDYTITVSGADIDGAVLTATEPVGMTADPATVRVDGVDPPAGTVSQQGDGLTIRLGAGADAAQGGTLAIGAYLITFDIAVPATVPANSTASASLAFTRNAVPDNATSNTVSLSGPDLGLSVPTDSGEDQILPLGTGQTGFYDAELTNPGADATGVTLTITVPKGLTIDTTADPVTRDDHWQTDDGADAAPITCTTPSSTMTCVVGAVAHDADTLLEIPVTATPHGTPGAEVQLIMSVTPDAGVEANPADNTLTATIRLTGIAVLDFTLTPSAHRVQIGATIDITTSVRNDGPQPAEEAVALALTDTDTTFKIVGFTGNTAPPALPALAARAAKHVVSFNRQAAGRGAAATRGRPGPLGAVVTSGYAGRIGHAGHAGHQRRVVHRHDSRPQHGEGNPQAQGRRRRQHATGVPRWLRRGQSRLRQPELRLDPVPPVHPDHPDGRLSREFYAAHDHRADHATYHPARQHRQPRRSAPPYRPDRSRSRRGIDRGRRSHASSVPAAAHLTRRSGHSTAGGAINRRVRTAIMCRSSG